MTDFIPPAKPIVGEDEIAAVTRVIRSGMLAQLSLIHISEPTRPY